MTKELRETMRDRLMDCSDIEIAMVLNSWRATHAIPKSYRPDHDYSFLAPVIDKKVYRDIINMFRTESSFRTFTRKYVGDLNVGDVIPMVEGMYEIQSKSKNHVVLDDGTKVKNSVMVLL